MILFLMLLWLVFSVLVGMYASSKGQFGILFFFVSLVISPLIAALIVAVLPVNKAEIEAHAVQSGDQRKCPYCAELVKAEAVICKHCRSELEPAPKAEPVTASVKTDEEYRRAFNIE